VLFEGGIERFGHDLPLQDVLEPIDHDRIGQLDRHALAERTTSDRSSARAVGCRSARTPGRAGNAGAINWKREKYREE